LTHAWPQRATAWRPSRVRRSSRAAGPPAGRRAPAPPAPRTPPRRGDLRRPCGAFRPRSDVACPRYAASRRAASLKARRRPPAAEALGARGRVRREGRRPPRGRVHECSSTVSLTDQAIHSSGRHVAAAPPPSVHAGRAGLARPAWASTRAVGPQGARWDMPRRSAPPALAPLPARIRERAFEVPRF